MLFPFLTQSVVDVGIRNQDIHFVYFILFAQLAFFLGKVAVEVIRSWILLDLSARINISLVSDFFIKLTNLPISYFDIKMTGDLLQRINDHKRIDKDINLIFIKRLIFFGKLVAIALASNQTWLQFKNIAINNMFLELSQKNNSLLFFSIYFYYICLCLVKILS